MALETSAAGAGIVFGGAGTLMVLGELPIEKTLLISLVLTALGAMAGCMHSVKNADTQGQMGRVFGFFFKWVFTAVIMAGAVSYVAETYLTLPAKQWPALVGMFITFFANDWQTWAKVVTDAVLARFVRRSQND